jgi:hypothetical protein
LLLQEKSFQRGVSYVVAMVAEFDEYTNDWLYLREGTVLPKYCISPWLFRTDSHVLLAWFLAMQLFNQLCFEKKQAVIQKEKIIQLHRILSQNKCLCQRSWLPYWSQWSTGNVGSEFGSCKISKRGYTGSQNGPGMFLPWHSISQLVYSLHANFSDTSLIRTFTLEKILILTSNLVKKTHVSCPPV